MACVWEVRCWCALLAECGRLPLQKKQLNGCGGSVVCCGLMCLRIIVMLATALFIAFAHFTCHGNCEALFFKNQLIFISNFLWPFLWKQSVIFPSQLERCMFLFIPVGFNIFVSPFLKYTAWICFIQICVTCVYLSSLFLLVIACISVPTWIVLRVKKDIINIWNFDGFKFFYFLNYRLTGSSGFITDGPGNYKYKTKCTWLIEGQ